MTSNLKFLGCEQLWAVDLTVNKVYVGWIIGNRLIIQDDVDYAVVIFDDRLQYFKEVQ